MAKLVHSVAIRSDYYDTIPLGRYGDPEDIAAAEARRAADESLKRIGVDYLDCLLIHWPCPDQDRYVETWRALIELRAEGRVRSIGVSNFMAPHLERLVGETGVTPVLNQIELHPRLI